MTDRRPDPLDDLLGGFDVPPMAAGLADRIVAEAQRPDRVPTMPPAAAPSRPRRRGWTRRSAWTAVLAVNLMLASAVAAALGTGAIDGHRLIAAARHVVERLRHPHAAPPPPHRHAVTVHAPPARAFAAPVARPPVTVVPAAPAGMAAPVARPLVDRPGFADRPLRLRGAMMRAAPAGPRAMARLAGQRPARVADRAARRQRRASLGRPGRFGDGGKARLDASGARAAIAEAPRPARSEAAPGARDEAQFARRDRVEGAAGPAAAAGGLDRGAGVMGDNRAARRYRRFGDGGAGQGDRPYRRFGGGGRRFAAGNAVGERGDGARLGGGDGAASQRLRDGGAGAAGGQRGWRGRRGGGGGGGRAGGGRGRRR